MSIPLPGMHVYSNDETQSVNGSFQLENQMRYYELRLLKATQNDNPTAREKPTFDMILVYTIYGVLDTALKTQPCIPQSEHRANDG